MQRMGRWTMTPKFSDDLSSFSLELSVQIFGVPRKAAIFSIFWLSVIVGSHSQRYAFM